MSEHDSKENGQWDKKDWGALDESMHEILPRLYLGDLNAAENVEALRSNNISCVLSIKRGDLSCTTREAYRKARISQVYIQKWDSVEEDLLSLFEPVCDMIEGQLAKGKAVLVHCALGKSRSATVVISYVMRYMNMNRNDAMEFVQRKRAVINPNPVFLKQLGLWEKCKFDLQSLLSSDKQPDPGPADVSHTTEGKEGVVEGEHAVEREPKRGRGYHYNVDCGDKRQAELREEEKSEESKEQDEARKEEDKSAESPSSTILTEGLTSSLSTVTTLNKAAYSSNDSGKEAYCVFAKRQEPQDVDDDPATNGTNDYVDTAAKESPLLTLPPEAVREILKSLHSKYPGVGKKKLLRMLNMDHGWNIGSKEFRLHLEAIVTERSAKDTAMGAEAGTASSQDQHGTSMH